MTLSNVKQGVIAILILLCAVLTATDAKAVVDVTPPTGTIRINNGALAVNSSFVTLNFSATDNSGAVSHVSVSNYNSIWSGWYPYTSTMPWTLAGGEGINTVYARFEDAAGNISSIVSDTIIVDTTPPDPISILINNDAAATNSSNVTFTLSATDTTSAVTHMRFSYDNIGWSAWNAYATTKAWTLSAGEGLRAVYVQFRDAAGNISVAANDTIRFDQTRPTGTISINNGAAFTNTTAVTFYLSAADNYGTVSQMRFSYDNVGWSPWSVYADTKVWTLTPGEGYRTVYVQFRDPAGNISTTASDTIRLDQTSPIGAVLINGAAVSTNATAVTLYPSASDNSGTFSQMRFSSDNVNWSVWEAKALTKAWALSAGNGVKTIYAQFRDAAGNVSTAASDTIMLDQTLPTGTISINNGAASTTSTAVTFNLSATDNSGSVSQMRFSYDNVGWSPWSAYAATKAWTLSAGDGLRTVYVQFRDAAGNVSTAASDTITLDSTRPIGTISINNGAAATNSTAVTFNLSATDNSGVVSQMRFSYDNVGWSAWSAYASTKVWTLSAGEGLRTVYVQFKDAVGNISIAASDTIRLDQTRPTGTISINSGALSTASTAVTLNLSATDNNGTVSQMRFSYDNAGWSAWSAYAATKGATLLPGLGIKTIYAQFRDAAGNVSASSSDTINLVPGVNISGRVTTKQGTGILNAVVSINTTPVPMTATTDVNGNYSINNIPAGPYHLTPSITGANGSLFSPATRNITVGTNNISGQDFSGVVTYSVSGMVNYTGIKAGRVYLGDSEHGTSIAAPGAFTIRGFGLPSNSNVKAYMDHIGDGITRVTNPSGSAHVSIDSSSNVTGVSITLTDPAPSVPTQPKILSVSPSNGAAIIEWESPVNFSSNYMESADSFDIYYGTSPSVSPTNGTKDGPVNPLISPKGYLLRDLTNGSALYFIVVSRAGANTSVPSDVYGPVTIGPRTGGNTVSGTITASGFTPTGSLILRLTDTAGPGVYSTVINSPSVSQPYSVTGVPNGSYWLAIVFDMNNNGFFDRGDFTNEAARADERLVSVSSNTIKNATINSADIPAKIRTVTDQSSSYQGTFFSLEPSGRPPVKVTIVSGPGMAGPRDLNKGQWLDFKTVLPLMNPFVVGDTYTITLTYLDGTSATITRSVTGFVDNILTALTPSGSLPGNVSPTFTWNASPSMLPSSGVYRIMMIDNTIAEEVWHSAPIPSTEVLAQFNFDGFAVVPLLTPGNTYYWLVEFEDLNGNIRLSNWLGLTP